MTSCWSPARDNRAAAGAGAVRLPLPPAVAQGSHLREPEGHEAALFCESQAETGLAACQVGGQVHEAGQNRPNATAWTGRAHDTRWRVVGAGTIGTIVEWYDFYLYGTAAALVINRVFFPNLNPLAGILASYATFAVGFLVRPSAG